MFYFIFLYFSIDNKKSCFSSSLMSKKVLALIKLNILAGKANPAPPIGSALGQRQVNIMEFCKQFNDRTKGLGEIICPTIITVYEDKSFSFIIKNPPASFYIKDIANIKSGSKTPGRSESIAVIKKADILKAVEKKMPDLNCFGNKESAFKMFVGSAKSMGIKVEE